jgi:hypothetical protein
MEFQKRVQRMEPGELFEAIRGSGGGVRDIKVFFPNPKAALLVDPETDLWLPWGRRKEQPGDWPEGGWARQESLAKPYWRRWRPVHVIVRPVRWMEKDRQRASHWFELAEGQGILCLRLEAAPGTPLYVVTSVATGDYLADIHERRPVIVGGSTPEDPGC